MPEGLQPDGEATFSHPDLEPHDPDGNRGPWRGERMLAMISAGPEGPQVDVHAGEAGWITCEIVDTGNGRKVAFVDELQVTPEYRGEGLGEQLVEGVTAQAVQLGATDLMSKITNERALAIRQKVFGRESLRFFEEDEGTMTSLPITYEQAMASLERARGHELNPEFRRNGIGVHVDLRKIDMNEWELPVAA